MELDALRRAEQQFSGIQSAPSRLKTSAPKIRKQLRCICLYDEYPGGFTDDEVSIAIPGRECQYLRLRFVIYFSLERMHDYFER
jgi:hypothetical protein